MTAPLSRSFFMRALGRIGRLLEPLLAPDAAAARQREERLLALVRQSDASVRTLTQEVAGERAELRRMRDLRAADVAEGRAAIAELRASVRRQGVTLARLAHAGDTGARLEWEEQQVRERLARAARSGRPVLVGPWTGEIGFELLYWIPFVRWAAEKFGIPPERLVIISRGGTESWYEGLAGRYVDVFSFVTPAAFKDSTEEIKKQRGITRFDRDLLRQVRRHVGAGRVSLLHPSLMYAMFMPFWKHLAALSRVSDHAEYRRIAPRTPSWLPELPRDYVAVRFYFSSCFPDTPGNRRFVAEAVAALAERHDVVMLNPGFRVDDHSDYDAPVRARIHSIDMSGRPEENLAAQSAIIAGARFYVGTYGGFAYLAPFCGTNALAFYSDRTYFVYHLELAQRAFAEVGGGTLEAIDVRNLDALRASLGAAPWETATRRGDDGR